MRFPLVILKTVWDRLIKQLRLRHIKCCFHVFFAFIVFYIEMRCHVFLGGEIWTLCMLWNVNLMCVMAFNINSFVMYSLVKPYWLKRLNEEWFLYKLYSILLQERLGSFLYVRRVKILTFHGIHARLLN